MDIGGAEECSNLSDEIIIAFDIVRQGLGK